MSIITDVLSSISTGIAGVYQDAKDYISTPTGAAIAGAVGSGAVIGTVLLATSAAKSTKSKTGKRIKHTKRGWKQDRARRSKQKWEVAYQRRKRRLKRSESRTRSHSKHGVKYTSNGQPYIILRSGKARFIKKRRR